LNEQTNGNSSHPSFSLPCLTFAFAIIPFSFRHLIGYDDDGNNGDNDDDNDGSATALYRL
jgi:hypothetical protein